MKRDGSIPKRMMRNHRKVHHSQWCAGEPLLEQCLLQERAWQSLKNSKPRLFILVDLHWIIINKYTTIQTPKANNTLPRAIIRSNRRLGFRFRVSNKAKLDNRLEILPRLHPNLCSVQTLFSSISCLQYQVMQGPGHHLPLRFEHPSKLQSSTLYKEILQTLCRT